MSEDEKQETNEQELSTEQLEEVAGGISFNFTNMEFKPGDLKGPLKPPRMEEEPTGPE